MHDKGTRITMQRNNETAKHETRSTRHETRNKKYEVPSSEHEIDTKYETNLLNDRILTELLLCESDI